MDTLDKTLKIGSKFQIIVSGFTIDAILVDKIESSDFTQVHDGIHYEDEERWIQYIGYAQHKIFIANVRQTLHTIPQVNDNDEVEDYVTLKDEDPVNINNVTILGDITNDIAKFITLNKR